jgi:hypothetical protein
MPTLELLIDASGMQRGATEAEAALRRVKTAVDSVASSSGGSGIYGGGSRVGGGTAFTFGGGGAASSAFQVGGGSLQIAGGIAQTAQALQGLNTQAAAFAAARTALELGNTIRDFQQFRGAVGGVSTVFGTLGAVIRANPIGAIATAIGLAATAMSLFGSKTKDAADNLSKLQQLRERTAETRDLVALGATDPRGSDDALRRAILDLRSGGRTGIPASEAASIFGVSEPFLRGGLQDFGIAPGALAKDTIRRDLNGRVLPPEEFRIGGIGPASTPEFVQRSFSASELSQFGEQLLREQQGRRAEATGNQEAAEFRAAEMRAEFESRERAEEESRQSQQEAAERIRDSMERAAQFGEQIGASVGDAAAQLLFAGSSFRSVISGLLRQFATQGLQSAGAGLFRAAVSGITGPQASANAGPPGGIGPPAP